MRTDVVIIGAGPFGLSIAAHLRRQGIDHLIVGKAVDTWRSHMPAGMMLRSEPYGSDMAAPGRGNDVAAYCRINGLDYQERLGPLSLSRWLDYADWFTGRHAPTVRDLTVTSVTQVEGGFQVDFAEEAPVTAGQVVVATGLLPFRVLPEELKGLPSDLVSHASDHNDLSVFRGKKVAVLGGGQSATETAALLHENGVDTRMVMRRTAVNWLTPNPATIRGLDYLRNPVNKLCEGWHCTFWNTPELFRRLPTAMRIDKARSVLGPAGAWWLKDRVQGVVEMVTSHQLRTATPHGDGLRLTLEGPQRTTELDVDHVITATGFRVDLERLSFLNDRLRTSVETLNRYPVLSRAGESTVPGLYFAGAAAAVSLGPSVRFIAGTHTSVPQLSRSLGQRVKASASAPVARQVVAAGL